MNKAGIAVAIILLTGFAVGAYIISAPNPEPRVGSRIDPGNYFDQSAATEERIRALEAAVAEERNARQLLEEELQILYAEIDEISSERQSRTEQLVAERQDIGEGRRQLVARASAASSAAGRIDRLIEAGFPPDRADWIVRREAELQMAAMQAQFDARRSGEPVNRFDPAFNSTAALRAELGDVEYEQYREANGQSTSVMVGSVIESSPGQRAGLQAGDLIIRYDGTRVFSTWELNQQTMQGEPGQSVVVDIVRDGMTMQVVLPRGPIGVSTGRLRGDR
ncbi:MAG: PDZ domain-containing protein [Gammaproteobacteria bacterium]|nr:PDZ domain-containing protein [Gammaproteobacteria bacterium]MDH3410305.1 PDZ domain-containing protein [Gammaproteobacteria bacterium]